MNKGKKVLNIFLRYVFIAAVGIMTISIISKYVFPGISRSITYDLIVLVVGAYVGDIGAYLINRFQNK